MVFVRRDNGGTSTGLEHRHLEQRGQGRSDDNSRNELRSMDYSQAVQALKPAGAVQAKGLTEGAVQEAASEGISGSSGVLPHLEAIQRSFGSHDVSGVRAHTDSKAAAAAASIGASAYATDNAVAFAGAPDLHTSAHEAAHVVQQRAGVQLKGGVGQAGDQYEQHADAVADHVVQGKSAEGLLDQCAPSTGRTAVQSKAVQRSELANMVAAMRNSPLLERARQMAPEEVADDTDWDDEEAVVQAPPDPVEVQRGHDADWARTMQIRSLNPADQARVRNNDATLEEVAPQTEELENFDGVTVRGSEDVDERARKLEAVKAGLGAVTGQGYVLPQTQVVLGELGSTSPSVATMVDPTTQDDGYNLFLSDQKFLAHSKMERNSDRGVRGGRRTAAYQDGPDARLPTGEVIREANGRAFKRNTPWGSGPRGVADQMGDRAHSKWRRSATNKRNKSEAMAKAIVVHEMGHVLHSQQSPEQFWQLKISGAAAPPDLAAKVSAYAGENALEFVAEVFTGRTLGIEYGSDVIAEYLKLGGPTVPKAQLQAPVDNLDALERAHAPVQVQGNQQGNQQGNPQGNPQNGGASTPNNFVTTALYGDNATGNIQHNFTWGAVSGRLEDLAGVATRERVRFDRDPALFMPAYNAYLLVDGRSTFQGTTLLKEGPAGNTGAGGDHHSAGYGAFFDAETGFTRAESMLTAVQWYEYKDAATNAWLPIPNAVFTIVRSMKREGGVLGMGKSYYLTTTKEGGGQSATARVKMHANQQSYNAAQRR